MKISTFEEIKAWQEARNLTSLIYKVTYSAKFKKDYGLSSQIQRAAVSIMANVAEGFERRSKNAFIQFLNYASASNAELQSHLYVALDRDYIRQEEFQAIYNKSKEVGRLINGFISYLRKESS